MTSRNRKSRRVAYQVGLRLILILVGICIPLLGAEIVERLFDANPQYHEERSTPTARPKAARKQPDDGEAPSRPPDSETYHPPRPAA